LSAKTRNYFEKFFISIVLYQIAQNSCVSQNWYYCNLSL